MFSQNNLLTMYSKSHLLCRAGQVFDEMTDRNVVSWTCMITGSIQNGECEMGFRLFRQMLRVGFYPNEFALASVVSACESYEEIKFGVSLHSIALKLGIDRNPYVGSSVLLMYAKNRDTASADIAFECIFYRDLACWNSMVESYVLNGYGYNAMRTNRFESYIAVMNSLTDLYFTLGVKDVALKVFDNILEKDVVSWNTLISAAAQEEDDIEAMGFFSSMLSTGLKPNQVLVKKRKIQGHASRYTYVWTSLVKAYSVIGSVGNSFRVFEEVGELDLVSWGVIISAFVKQGLFGEALSLVNCLREDGQQPDEFILANILNACCNAALIIQCRCIHSHVVKTGHEKHFCVASAVIDAYAKCGDIISSKMAFDNSSVENDAILYNTMITAYAHHGLIKKALELYEQMRRANVEPTQATFVAVISACNHLGLVEQGKYIFNSISYIYGMQPTKDHFLCLIDLLARNGLLEEAKAAIESMPYEPWPAAWRSLLNGCRIHGNKEMGEFAAQKILKLVPNDDGVYVLLSNIYAEDGRWECAEKIRMKMEERRAQKSLEDSRPRPGIGSIRPADHLHKNLNCFGEKPFLTQAAY
ncbi:Pentatricopeptide repeat-containing protein [Ananas comosus]|uniref:Pentatricopeptide repeat-containing protein n=1 Tax=Ananas comosus TaxID=4615 RepID=A0A199VLJ9_ANACO|nr:Pentatricopeptide repeat-containing protein [Ananas comosus]